MYILSTAQWSTHAQENRGKKEAKIHKKEVCKRERVNVTSGQQEMQRLVGSLMHKVFVRWSGWEIHVIDF